MKPTASIPLYLNRELSWLEFDQRVLDEAADPSVPLLERLKFLAISSSNLDEFFMVRVGGLRLLVDEGSTSPDFSGLSPARQLRTIHSRVHLLAVSQEELYLGELQPALREAGIRHLEPEELTTGQREYLREMFENEIALIHTPSAVAGQSFPLLRNLGLNLGVRLRPAEDDPKGKPRYAVIPVAENLERIVFVPSDSGERCYLFLEELLCLFADAFFPGNRIAETVVFRVTRNAGMNIDEDGASDLLAEMEDVLDARTFSECVRLEIAAGATRMFTQFLMRALQVSEEETYALKMPIDPSVFMGVFALDGFDELRYEGMPTRIPPEIDPSLPMVELIAKGDILLCHPYESFDPVLRFIREAAEDPDVLAIKQVLYRTSRQSPIIDALRVAIANGKAVTVLVEVKARFDEARNIDWARRLEMDGAQVIYGVKGLKTHSKVCLVIRRETRGIVRYMHFGTGNYNEHTARLYSDIGLFTDDDDLGADTSAFFNAVAGYSTPQVFRKLAVAPLGLREKLIELIDAEAERCRQGQKATITAKLNSLVDQEVIDALYEASKAGVKIRLNIRGICCLRPGVKGVSENIRVVSIVDRFLEHARIIHFHHGGKDQLFISSADWMPRNLRRRVELLVPVEDTRCRRKLVSILGTYFADTVKGRELQEDGRQIPRVAKKSKTPVRAQYKLYDDAVKNAQRSRQHRRTVFEPHQPKHPEK